MRHFRLLFLMLAAAVVFAHSVSPHHHHDVDQEIAQVESHDHDTDHHHHDAKHEHPSEGHHHSIFTFSQIDEAFLTVKYVFSHLDVVPVTLAFEWKPAYVLLRETNPFLVQNSERPPLIRWCAISFRGPPVI